MGRIPPPPPPRARLSPQPYAVPGAFTPNCRNCGAPPVAGACACRYCGTPRPGTVVGAEAGYLAGGAISGSMAAIFGAISGSMAATFGRLDTGRLQRSFGLLSTPTPGRPESV